METKSEILDFILGLSTDVERKSTLQLALEQARHLIGYDNAQGINRCCFETRNTEAIINEMKDFCSDESCLLGALTFYLIALDCLGCIFVKSKGNDRITKLLEEFDIECFKDLSSKKAVQNLRDSLCHNFGLANRSNKYVLCYDNGGNNDIFGIYRKQKKTDWSDKQIEHQTVINVFQLCRAFEDTISVIIRKYKEGIITSNIENDELKARFTILFSH